MTDLRLKQLLCLVSVLASCSGGLAEGPLPTGGRGDGTGRFPETQPPTEWSKKSENILWTAEIPSGYSSPVRLSHPDGDRIFLTGEPSEVLCLDAESGETLWQKSAGYVEALGEAEAERIDSVYAKLNEEKRAISKVYDALRKSDPDSPKLDKFKQERKEIDKRRKEFEKQFPPEKRGGARNAAATVVCDGERVFAVFGTGIVAAFTVDGDRLWIKHTEVPQQGFGHSASPVIAGGQLIVHIQHLVAYDPVTGSQRWQADVRAKFGSPVITKIDGEEIVVTPSGALVVAKTGRVLAEKQFQMSENSPLIHEGRLFAHESGSVKAFQLPNSLDEPFELEQLWEAKGARDQRMASAIYHDGLLYAGGRRGIMDVIDAETGKLVYRERLEIGELFPSPVFAGGLVFFSGKNGKTLVLKPGREFEEVALNESDRFSSSLIFSGKRLYLRADRRLHCIGE